MTHPSGSGGASFRVDMEQAPQAIKELESALHQLEDIKRDAEALGAIDAGSRDSVSIEAARLIGAAAVGGAGSFVPAIEAGIEQIRQLIDSMNDELSSYDNADSESATRLNLHDHT